ncbi:hypothetical protein [Lacibacter sp.]|uniref:hypothetical protein n=1 Tax=Lacibacter sp. TaxID=1915409 RepID=UPI002B4B270B|nr:hypothetical protein [Lacibacter sp.]HLP38085.1 hypothetical protein [Lacibacter sp.]
MNLLNWLKKWKLEKLKINAKFLEIELNFTDSDKAAAWELYVELLTRVATQQLSKDGGDEKQALQSIYNIFPLTREILKKNGPDCFEFTKIAVVVLNQIIRPFATKWHKTLNYDQEIDMPTKNEFRSSLESLRVDIIRYAQLLSEIAGVEDLTELELEA